jgi:hypothetical protein
MASESKYKILVSATINKDSVQIELDKISKQVVLKNVKLTIDVAEAKRQVEGVAAEIQKLQKVGAGGGIGGAGGANKATLIDTSGAKTSLTQLREVITQIKQSVEGAPIKVKVNTDETKKITSAVLTYNDLAGNAQQKTLRWTYEVEKLANGTEQIVPKLREVNSYTDDGISKERTRQAEVKKTTLYMEKMHPPKCRMS